MTGLLVAEIRRFTSRRLFHLLAALLLAAVVAAAVVTAVESSQSLVQGVDDRFVYLDVIDASRSVSLVLFVLGLVISASFVGAEWSSGSITTMLTWEPRRSRVYTAKTLVAALMIGVGTVATLAFLAVIFLPVAAFRGTTEGLDGSTWWTLAGIWARGAGVAAFGACVGSALATMTRNTAGAIGVFFGYSLVIENILAAIRDGRLQPWLLIHVLAHALGNAPLLQAPTISSAVLLPIYAAAVLAAALAVFQRRDVT